MVCLRRYSIRLCIDYSFSHGWMHGRVDQFWCNIIRFSIIDMCDCNCHILFYILELLNGIFVEVLNFNIWVQMQ
jgi:hypothetical protein